MRIMSIGAISIKCNFLMIGLILFAVIFDMWVSLVVAFISLSLHEASHVLIAKAVGACVTSIEIQPFGFVARLSGRGLSNTDEFAVASAGPVFSLIAGCVAAYASTRFGGGIYVLDEFVRFNITLGLLNLFPALPLDGGRMFRAFMERFLTSRMAFLLSVWPGVILGAVLSAFGLCVLILRYTLNITPFVMGIFLFISALMELKMSHSNKLSAMIKRTDTINRGEEMTVRYTALHKSVTAFDALRMLSFNRYNLIIVVDGNLHKIGELDEPTLISGMAAYGNNTPIGELIKMIPPRNTMMCREEGRGILN